LIIRTGAEQNQNGTRRGLFEGLEEGVGGFFIERVGIVEHHEPVLAPRWFDAQDTDHFVDQFQREFMLFSR
jgi:hypothetical protein